MGDHWSSQPDPMPKGTFRVPTAKGGHGLCQIDPMQKMC